MGKSRGIGDTIEKIMKATGVKNLVETVSGAIGIDDCGCEARKNSLNKMFPYKNNNDESDLNKGAIDNKI
jgi:hypothetical protein